MTAPDDLSVLRQEPFSKAVTKFEELLVQNGRAFLIGAGCSKCAGLPLTAELSEKAIESDKLDGTSKAVLASLKNLFAGSANAHIEDYLSELVDLLAIAERRTLRGASQAQVPLEGKQYSAAQLRAATEQIKVAISSVINDKSQSKHIKRLSLLCTAPFASVKQHQVPLSITSCSTMTRSSKTP